MAYDAARGVTVLFGGGTASGGTSDTWEWNGTAWTQRAVSGPSPRQSHAMVYDAVRGVSVLFGGVGDHGILSGETWEWNGTTWTQRLGVGPSPRYGHAMSFDAARAQTVLFGGFDGSVYFDETWELGAPCIPLSITSQPTAQAACPGGSASFTVTPAGTGPFVYRWQAEVTVMPGTWVDLADHPGPNALAGTNSSTLTINTIALNAAGRYRVLVTNPCGNIQSNPATLSIGGPGCCTADFNHDGHVNSQDFFDFLAAFFAGC
jgi:hypothetical protein